jgi:hypothetical protein
MTQRANQHVKIPGEVAGWRELVGKIYRSPRFTKPFTFGLFGMERYEAAARVLIPWPDGLFTIGPDCGGLPEVGHPLTVSLFEKAKKKLLAISGKADGAFVSNGFYRPPGVTWGIGKYADVDGAIDSTDRWGHWRLAIDLGRRDSAASFGVDTETLLNVLKSVGIIRPMDYGERAFETEPWHFRPGRAQREMWVENGQTMYK